MARDHARIKTAIWRDEDWRALTPDAQWLYQAMTSQQALTYVGVLDWRPGRFAALAHGMTTRRVEKAAAELVARRFVVVDEQTEEALVRTYVRHDGVLDRANMGKAVARALQNVISMKIRQAILIELGRIYEESPRLAGWAGIADLFPDVMTDVTSMASVMPLPFAPRKA